MDCLSTQRLIPPKRAITAFFCYQRERKKTIKEENLGLVHKSLIRKVAKEWKNMSKQEKRKYIEESNKDKIRYREQRNKYNEKMKKLKEEAKQQREKERKIKDEKPQEENNNCLMTNFFYIDDDNTYFLELPLTENYLKINCFYYSFYNNL